MLRPAAKHCPQAARYDTGVQAKKLLELETVLEAAKQARAHGATRFCMGAAWRGPKERDLDHVAAMIRGVKELGLEACATLGMLEDGQAERLKDAGLDVLPAGSVAVTVKEWLPAARPE